MKACVMLYLLTHVMLSHVRFTEYSLTELNVTGIISLILSMIAYYITHWQLQRSKGIQFSAHLNPRPKSFQFTYMKMQNAICSTTGISLTCQYCLNCMIILFFPQMLNMDQHFATVASAKGTSNLVQI